MYKDIINIIKLIFKISKVNFFYLNFILIIDLFVTTISVFSIVPLADLLINPELENPSKITVYLMEIFNEYEIEISLISFSLIFLTSLLSKAFIFVFINHLSLKIKYSFIEQLYSDGFQKILNTNWTFFTNNKSGLISNTFLKEIMNIGTTISNICKCFAAFIQIIILLIIPFFINAEITLITLIFFFLVYYLVTIITNPISIYLGKKNTQTSNELNSIVNQVINYAKIIIANNKKKTFVKFIIKIFRSHIKITLKYQILNNLINSFTQPVGFIIIISVFIYFSNKGIVISEFSAIFYSLLSITKLVGNALSLQLNISNFIPSYKQYKNLLISANREKLNFGKNIFDNFKKEIYFKNISFYYDKNNQVLSNVSFSIKKNSIVGLIGKSGSGKSTLADILLMMLKPSSGDIYIDNKKLSNYEIGSYRDKVGYIGQEVYFFNDTLRNNLDWFSNRKNTDREIFDTLKLTDSDKFVNKLPKKLDTVIGDKGLKLSGGQRQRLSLTRTLLRKPKILILDEATSSVDAISEKLIEKTIQKINKKNKITILIISHKTSSVKNVDKLILLKNKKIQTFNKSGKISLSKSKKYKKFTQTLN